MAMLLIAACSSLSALHPLPSSGVSVDGDKIISDGKPFAELRYYFTAKSNPTLHRRLSIYYFGDNRRVWIYPEKGLEEAIAAGHFKPHSKRAARLDWVFDVSISSDGKAVTYKVPGDYWASSYKYLMEKRK